MDSDPEPDIVVPDLPDLAGGPYAEVSWGESTSSTIEVRFRTNTPLRAFQFTVSGVPLTGAFLPAGVSWAGDFSVDNGPTTVLVTPDGAGTIPPLDGVAIVLEFASPPVPAFICLSADPSFYAFADADDEAFDVTPPEPSGLCRFL